MQERKKNLVKSGGGKYYDNGLDRKKDVLSTYHNAIHLNTDSIDKPKDNQKKNQNLER